MKINFILTIVALFSVTGFAQEKQLSDQDLVDIEELYKTNETEQTQQPIKTNEISEEDRKALEAIKKNAEFQKSQLKSSMDLTTLSPFSDVSMIQKKFLPKTERFQIYTALGLSTNSPWFYNLGGKVNLTYNFTEKYGIEFSGLFLTSSEKEAAKDIRENNSLQPEQFILTKSNINIDFVWYPIYGKITNLDQQIIPYDMYFSLGGGVTGTNAVEKNVATAHLAIGQIFALSKSLAFRWDYSVYLYKATPVQSSTPITAASSGLHNDLVFTAGISFFFPEVNYR